MMINWKKATTGTLIAVMALGIFGCSPKNSSSNKIPEGTLVSETPITFSMLYADNATYPLKKDWLVLQEIEKRTNVKLDLQVVPDSDYQEKRKILMSSGSMPDIITHTYAEQASEFATNNVLLPISDYMNQMPNLTERISRWNLQSEWEQLKELDGKVYVAQGFYEKPEQTIQLGIRSDLLTEQNISTPESYEQLYEAMKKIKEKHPETLGLSDRAKGDLILCMISRAFNTNAGYSLPNGYTYDYSTQSWVFAPTSEQYKEMLVFLNKLYNEGLLDPEAFTQDTNQFKQKLFNGKAVAAGLWLGEETNFTTEIKGASGNQAAVFEPILPLAGPRGTRATKSASRLNRGFTISNKVADKPYRDQLLKFVDWFYFSDEGITLTSWGAEGITYQMNNGKKELLPEISTARNPGGTKLMTKDFGTNTNSFQIVVDPEYRDFVKTDSRLAFDKALIEGNMIPKDDPILKFTSDELEQQKLLASTLKDYYKEMTSKFIFGQASIETDWDKFVKECSNKKVDELMKLVNTAWVRQNQEK